MIYLIRIQQTSSQLYTLGLALQQWKQLLAYARHIINLQSQNMLFLRCKLTKI